MSRGVDVVARMAALLARLPVTVTVTVTVAGVTVNRLCASGLEAVIQAGRAIAVGDALGARLAGAVAHQVTAADSGVGVAALCIGVGHDLALVVER
jgi:acetyl-CoA acetyltransferase